jgi:hypothetical protein
METPQVLLALGSTLVCTILNSFHSFLRAFVTFKFFLQASQVVAYVDFLSFNRTIQVVQRQTKFNNFEVLDKHKMVPMNKARMVIPLCRMISMLIDCPTLKIDVLKMEQAF